MSDENSTPLNPADPTVGPDRDFLETVVKALVDHPEEVEVTRTVDDLGVLLKLRVHQEDMKRVIGRSGQTAKSIRTLLRVVGSKFDLRVNLKILESDGSEYRAENAPAAAAPVAPAAETPAEEAAPAADSALAFGQPTEVPAEQPAAEKKDDSAASAFDNII